MDIKVTVYCIAFNHEKYIARCLDSLINQKTDFSYEVIVHDDASTDGTREIIEQYALRHPELIIPVLQDENQYSKGVDFLKKYLIPITRGKYCMECEGDDYWCDKNKLQLQVEALDLHPACSICVHRTDTVTAEGTPGELHFPPVNFPDGILSSSEFIHYTLEESKWMFHLSSIMIPTENYRQYMEFKTQGFPSKFYKVGDLPLFLYFSLKGDFYFIDRVMTVYTLESGGFMTTLNSNKQFALKVHRGYIDGLNEFDKYSGYRYSQGVKNSITERKFEIDRLEGRFDRLVSVKDYRRIIMKRKMLKRAGIYIFGYPMLLFRRYL